ncbi:hypothetical protein FXF51_01870 [Nonomuraea sp. PA05]|uniref:hypothetical protein n=1 Tax=Nonomuraea sp. PA05 TaxID=2604466 RepID=UPI0011DBD562|nr:hypothetical protein [Nonomuraea sp. PA05]TYB71208.1 hypothetical protein FXF51_01870 [Nonomuraea sp. PA05]
MTDILALCHCGELYAQHTTWEQRLACADNDPSIKAAHLLEIGDVILHPMFGEGDEPVIVVADLADNDGLMTITPHKGPAFQYAADLGVQLYTEREAAIYGALNGLLEAERDRIRLQRARSEGCPSCGRPLAEHTTALEWTECDLPQPHRAPGDEPLPPVSEGDAGE